MSGLGLALDEYLAVRRALGFKMDTQAGQLAGFVAFADQADVVTITTEVALAWAMLPPGASPGWQARRLHMVCGFARHLHGLDPRTEVPPADLLTGRNYRPTPYLYSADEVDRLRAAARELSPPLRAATLDTLIGLLSVTGLRIGEAIRLDRDDIDPTGRTLLVHDPKRGASRLLPLHPSTIDALGTYSRLRDRLCPQPSAPSMFVSTRGSRLAHTTIYTAFGEVLRHVGLEPPAVARRPRVHDFRHAFAVNTLVNWYRDGGDIGARLPLLSGYLGHASPAATYWYLSAAPELLRLAAERLDHPIWDRP